MGPSARECKSGNVLNLKLNFTNQKFKGQNSAVKPPIKIMLYINEINEDFESDSAGKTTVDEEEEDVIGDSVIFSVSYLNV